MFVRVTLNIEGFGESRQDEVEISRAEWESKNPQERTDLLDELAAEYAANYVGWGWYIEDQSDMRDTE